MMTTTDKTRVSERILSLVLIAAMIISLLPLGAITAFAASADEVEIRIVDESKAPIEGASLRVDGEDVGATTDAEGKLTLTGLTEGESYELVASKFGYANETVEYTVADPYEQEITLMLLQTVTVYGVVKNAAEQPIEGASVSITGYSSYTATTNEQGEFNVAGVYAGQEYTYSISFADYKTATGTLNLEALNEITISQKDTVELSFEQAELEIKYGTTGINVATSEAGNATSYWSEDTGVAVVDEGGTVTPTGIGTTTIRASREETADVFASEASYQLTVRKGDQDSLYWSVTPPLTLTLKDSFATTAEGGTGAGEVTYATSNATIAEVDETGSLTLHSVGEVTITATKAGNDVYDDASIEYTLTITKAPQAELAFAVTYPDAIYYGETYTNVAAGGSVTTAVEYSSSDESVATVASDGTITALKSGTVTITATLAGDDTYEPVSAEYTIVIYRADQIKEFRFLKGDGTHTIKYGEEFTNAAEGGENSPISYASSDEAVATVDETGKITTLKQGETVITATNPEDDRFNAKEISYTLVVERADQNVVFENGTTGIEPIEYGQTYTNKAEAHTAVMYSVSDDTIATVNAYGVVTPLKAGTVTITAEAEESDQYNSASNAYTIQIKKAPQALYFDKGAYNPDYGTIVDEVTFNDNEDAYVNAAHSEQQGDAEPVTYSIASGANCLTDFDDETGAFTIVKAGTIVISAAVDSTDQYKTATASYTLIVHRASQQIAFPEATYSIVSGHDFTEAPKAMPVAGTLYGTGAITYSVKEDESGIVRSIEEDGTLDLSYKTGSATILATKASDDRYEEATAEYTLTVTPWALESGVTYYTLDGEKTTEENEWFVGNVSLNAVEGYLISLENDKDSAEWVTSFADIVTTDGIDNEVSFFVKNEDGDISAQVTEIVKKDSVTPEATLTTEAPSIFEKMLTILTFGIHQPDNVEYTATGISDLTSGVAKIEYYVDTTTTETMSREALDALDDWKEYTGTISVAKDQAFVVYLKVTDHAGLYVYVFSNGDIFNANGVIFDATGAAITLEPSASNVYANNYYTGDVTFDLNIEDASPSSGISTIDYVVTVNDIEKYSNNLYTYVSEEETALVPAWNSTEREQPIVIPADGLVETDVVKLTVTVTDLSGNVSEKTEELRILATAAGVTVTPIEPDGFTGAGYWNKPVDFEIRVSGRPSSFSADKVKYNVTAKDATGTVVAPNYVVDTWHDEGDDYVTTITFNGDANYTGFYVTYKDSGENGLTGASEPEYSFTVDQTAPTGSISISENTWDSLLEILTFGIYSKESVQVTATADDVTSPIKSVEYFVETEKKTAYSKAELESTEKWITWENSEMSALTFDPNKTFVVYLKVTDQADNVAYLCSSGYILDNKESKLVLTPDEPNDNGYYNSNVTVKVAANDMDDSDLYSGIKSIDYWIECDGVKTQEGNLFTFTPDAYPVEDLPNHPVFDELVHSWNSDENGQNIIVDSAKNNSDNVTLHVKVVDNAGNESSESLAFHINATAPTAAVSYVDEERENAVNGYYMSRSATLTVTDRSTTFDEAAATAGISIDVANNSESIDRAVMIGEWEHNENTHRVTITYSADAAYTFAFAYTNKAGVPITAVDFGNSENPMSFTVDNTKPTCVVTVEKNTWDSLLELLTFGIWSNDSVTVEAAPEDVTSPIQTVEYFKTDRTTAYTAEELETVTWNAFPETLTINPNEIFTVYLKVTDNAGNYDYFSTNGHVVDNVKATAVITPEPANKNGYYNRDVNVQLHVKDAAPYSGINHVEWWVENNGDVSQEPITLYQFAVMNPAYEDLVSALDFDVVVESEKNNSDNVVIKVKTIDNAGNEKIDELPIKIDITAPTISWMFEDEAFAVLDGRGYFAGPRTATIVITERSTTFDKAAATAAIQFAGVNFAGKVVALDRAMMISDWTDAEGDTPDAATHTATVTFATDANYTVENIVYTDKAGNVSTSANTGESVTPYIFTVDGNAPTAMISIDTSVWDQLIETLTFGLWKNETVSVSATSSDETTKTKIEYYKTDAKEALTLQQLEAIEDEKWSLYEDPIPIESDERLTVYLRVTDLSGNRIFISTNGYIVDKTKSDIAFTYADPNENGYYNGNVDIVVTVNDKEPYSGLNKVEYWVTSKNDGVNATETQRETLYSFNVANNSEHPVYGELIYEFASKITVDASKNNSDEVTVFVKVTDNAGNESVEFVTLKIDATEPTIAISFNNNKGNVYEVDGQERGYFDQNRIATIVITERTSAFNTSKATEGIAFTAVNSSGKTVEVPRSIISEWETKEGATPDTATHTATVTFDIDANYDFGVSYTDEAGNAATRITTDDSVTPYAFTVDKLEPTATVSIMNKSWNTLLEFLTFGLWSNKAVDVTAEAEDATSPFVIEFYKTDRATQMTADELDAITDWNPYEAFEVDADERFVVYLKVTDYAGNYLYINSDGVVVEKTPAGLTLTPDKTEIFHNEVGVYNKDVNVQVEIREDAPYSGLKTVEYWVTCDGAETQRETIFAFDLTSPTQDQLESEFSYTITVDAASNNSCDVVLYVGVTDNAGNYTEKSVKLDIDITPPAIFLSYDNNESYKIENENGYFPQARTATVVITERAGHFNSDLATQGIDITALDVDGNAVMEDCRALISAWNTVRDLNAPDKDTHTATIDYSADANYTFAISYTDLAGNENTEVQTKAATPYRFTVDQTDPTGSVKVGTLGVWDSLIETLTFGLWSRDTVSVSGEWADATSPIESVSFYKTADTTAKTAADLDKVTEWAPFSGFDVKANELFTVYLRIVDYAGNITYISTDGIIVDEDAPVVESIAPQITIEPQQPVNGIYNTDVTVAVKVEDPQNDGAYSGLKEIRYEIYNLGEKTQEGTLYTFELVTPIQNQLLRAWEDEKAIVVDRNLNNSNDVVIKVFAVDNSGNTSDASTSIKIDVTPPAISISYNNDNGDTAFADGTTDAFFNANRTATIVVTERNFDPELFVLTLTNSDNVIPTLSGWNTESAGGNGDGTKHIATVTFDADGDYTIDAACTDLVGNKNTAVQYNGLAPQKFTIDKTPPVLSVSYDNNSAQNGNYYKEDRVATITITEHNFEPSRVNISLTGSAGLGNVAWASSGDMHTATIAYRDDALYTFDITYQDKAGNTIADYAGDSFYIDKTAPKVEISGIVDESANNEKGNIGFVITATDTNFDVFAPVITAVLMDENGKIVTKSLETEKPGSILNGQELVVKNLTDDGIYRITCTVIDKAGNAFTEVTLHQKNGNGYTVPRSGSDNLITFSVNRSGSTYEVDDYTAEITEKYFVQHVTDNITVVEINADPLKSYAVTLNGKELAEGTDYAVIVEGGNGDWYKYTYQINQSLFENEGEYNLVISSTDKAENDAFSDIKGATVAVVVDRTAPVVSVSGLATNARYQTEKQTVTLIPADDGGALKSLTVLLVDENGKTIKELVNLEGEALENALTENDGKITLELDEGLYQNVRIICDDAADYGEEENVIYDEYFNNVSVSSSAIKIFWANKPLRWGVIGGAGGLGAAAVAAAILKKRKKVAAK